MTGKTVLNKRKSWRERIQDRVDDPTDYMTWEIFNESY